jgi:mono/diheme cytochrome c family protein
MNTRLGMWTVALGMISLAGCHTDMWVQPRDKVLNASEFFADGRSSRPPVPGTVAHGNVQPADGYHTGWENGKLVKELPVPLTRELLYRGQERFNIYCAPCHGKTGDGKGMITQRGLILRRQPANYHTDRLRQIAIGHFFDVITNGYGIMYSYAGRVDIPDRWAIAAYIRALQYSQNVPADQLGETELQKVRESAQMSNRGGSK